MGLRICLVTSELAPFAKTGGLADAAAGLARWLSAQGHDVRIVMPLYAAVDAAGHGLVPATDIGRVEIGFGGGVERFGCRYGRLPDSAVPVFFVDCPERFDRPAMYSAAHADEHLRFALLCRAAIEVCQRLAFAPDVFHCNDWHTGLLPLYLRSLYAWDRLFDRSRTLLTIHNIAFQGVFPAGALDELGLGGERGRLDRDDLERRGIVNFLKTGLLNCDRITTVSETYAREILTPVHGHGLESVLAARGDRLSGIINGVDYGTWDPAVDSVIPARYSADDLRGKTQCKARLLARLGLHDDGDTMAFGVVSRLTGQKGFDLLPDMIDALLEDQRIRLCVLGSGERRFEEWFDSLSRKAAGRVAFRQGYDEELAHWIEAGADAFLMPSAFEPCGLNQLYSLRYGTPPVVHRTGGLADTVEAWDAATGRGTGFLFDEFRPAALLAAMREAARSFADRAAWRRLVANGMRSDFSWDRQGPRYVALYERLVAG